MEKPIEMIYLQSVANAYSCQLAIVYGRLLYLTQEGKIPCQLKNNEIHQLTNCANKTILKIIRTLSKESLVFIHYGLNQRTFTINTNHPIFINYFGKSAKG